MHIWRGYTWMECGQFTSGNRREVEMKNRNTNSGGEWMQRGL